MNKNTLTVILIIIIFTVGIILAIVLSQSSLKRTNGMANPYVSRMPSSIIIQQKMPSPTSMRTQEVKIYLNSTSAPEGQECTQMYPVTRTIPITQSVARATIEELLKGPTQKEINDGYYTSINPNVRIQKITIIDGVTRIDFSKELEQGIGGSCKVTAIRSQITKTLEQFSSVQQVIISIDGRTEDILQP